MWAAWKPVDVAYWHKSEVASHVADFRSRARSGHASVAMRLRLLDPDFANDGFWPRESGSSGASTLTCKVLTSPTCSRPGMSILHFLERHRI